MAALLGSCTSSPGPDFSGTGQKYIVTGKHAAFYRYGPAQALGPDFVLAEGRKVVLLKKEYGFSQIQTDDGHAGYVANEEIAPAPPEPTPRPVSRTKHPVPLPVVDPKEFEVRDALPELAPEDKTPRFRY